MAGLERSLECFPGAAQLVGVGVHSVPEDPGELLLPDAEVPRERRRRVEPVAQAHLPHPTREQSLGDPPARLLAGRDPV